MVDLDAMCARTFPVRLHGRELDVLIPSAGTVRRILALSDCPDGELVDRQLRLAAEILARNEQGVPVGREALEALPPSALGAVIAQAASLAASAASVPD